MEQTLLEYLFRFVMYVTFGFTLEIVFSVIGIERALGYTLNHRVPKKYLEGFVSLYMIPVHGFGMLFAFEYVTHAMAELHVLVRYLVYCVLISGAEVIAGFIYDKIFGFYSWDYYAESKYRVFKRGYTLWTLVPQWGIAGLILEAYSGLLVHISPAAAGFLRTIFMK
jgi:uncharacterized membrane protein